ncbi:hypothetical protein BAY1663_03045 [Pseudomonas sp. BAY1663]|nr:hypothetical protein BAY1663_03045 [Pseudomonas sp. BAY1663]
MDAAAGAIEGQEGRPVQQGLEVQLGAFADQFEVEAVGLGDGFVAVEGQHLQVVLEPFDAQREMGLAGCGEHPCSSCFRPWRDA